MAAIPGRQDIKTVHIAAMDGNCAAIQRWLDAGLFVDKRDAAKRTCLHQAAWSGRLQVVTLLLGAYAEINARDGENRTPLHYCSETGFTAVIKELLAFKADIDAVDGKRETAVSKAARAGHAEALQMLINAGAVIDVRDVDGHLLGDRFDIKVPADTRQKIRAIVDERRKQLTEEKRSEEELRRAVNAEKGPKLKPRGGSACLCCTS